jgi:SAM-dependent methyltransferase
MTTGSEYSAKAEPGSMIETPLGPVRNEDVTCLSFEDRSFRAVLSFGVLEHVPNYRAALREFSRVLTAGGQLILSVPFVFDEHTVTRARLDENGDIEHLLEPVYHGDPMTGAGVLCYQEFGMDMLREMKSAGCGTASWPVFTPRNGVISPLRSFSWAERPEQGQVVRKPVVGHVGEVAAGGKQQLPGAAQGVAAAVHGPRSPVLFSPRPSALRPPAEKR